MDALTWQLNLSSVFGSGLFLFLMIVFYFYSGIDKTVLCILWIYTQPFSVKIISQFAVKYPDVPPHPQPLLYVVNKQTPQSFL